MTYLLQQCGIDFFPDMARTHIDMCEVVPTLFNTKLKNDTKLKKNNTKLKHNTKLRK